MNGRKAGPAQTYGFIRGLRYAVNIPEWRFGLGQHIDRMMDELAREGNKYCGMLCYEGPLAWFG